MELEELKLKWKVLSERLDREQVIRRQDMERMLRGRVGSYLHYVQLMLLLGVAVVPLCVAIGKFRGVPGIKNRGIKKCKAKDNQIIIHFSSVPLF